MAVVNTNVNVTDSAFVNNDGAVYFETSDSDHGFDLRVSLLQACDECPAGGAGERLSHGPP